MNHANSSIILKNSSDNKIFNTIINKESFSDEEILSEIARSNEYDKFIRVEALNKLDNDQSNETIKEIAFNETDEHVCSAAIEKLDSETDLIEIALNSSYSSSRLKATEKINTILKEKSILRSYSNGIKIFHKYKNHPKIVEIVESNKVYKDYNKFKKI